MSLLDRILGKPLSSADEESEKIGVLSGVAILGLDGLSSAAYGPEAAMTLLLPLGMLGLQYSIPIMTIILLLLAILYFSYLQTISAYPTGGGSYTVAKENLGTEPGLLAAAALMLDYILNVAVGIAAGVGALISAVPQLKPYTLTLCLIILALLTFVNLRGSRESGLALAVPMYLFVGSLLAVLGTGLVRIILSGGHPQPLAPFPAVPAATVTRLSLGTLGLVWLLLRSFASGCTAMTGVEAVSNAVNAFEAPSVKKAQQTLTLIVVILGALLGGVAYVSHVYGIGATDPDSKQYESVLSQLTHAVFGGGPLYYIVMGCVLAVLALSANTSFAGFPRLSRLLALDGFLPSAFAHRGRRLVYTLGIAVLTTLSAALLIAFGGITDRLIPLFAIGAFLAFTLSQAGMVVHWRRHSGPRSGLSLAINGLGCVCTGIALAIILVAKFTEGAWITVMLIPALLLLFNRIKRHYEHVATEIRCDRPMSLHSIEPPVFVVPMRAWSTVSERALRFAVKLSPDVIVVQVIDDECAPNSLHDRWDNLVVEPTRAAGVTIPRLDIVPSPYRRLFTPLFGHLEQLKQEFPDRFLAIIIPELVEMHWYDYLLHNHRATAMKAALLLRGDKRLVVINIPWYIQAHDAVPLPQPAAPGASPR